MKDATEGLITPTSTLQPHQQRVVEERDQLADRLGKLGDFILGNPQYVELPPKEQQLLNDQHAAMSAYHAILGQRIAGFAGAAA